MVQTQVQLREEQLQALKRLAEMRGVSIEELIQQGVDQLLRSLYVDEERWTRAMNAVGRFRSGRTDISVNHDAYLVEAFSHFSTGLEAPC